MGYAIALAVLIVVFAEVSARGYWVMRGLPMLTCHRVLHRAFYPEVTPVEEADVAADDGYFDILLVAGSVLDKEVSYIQGVLEHRLGAEPQATSKRYTGDEARHLSKFLYRATVFESPLPVRVFNISMGGHNSRDSFYKYRRVADKKFDLVILYHGINDTRANNCPPEVFRADYSHYTWYRTVNAVERGPALGVFVFPLTWKIGFIALQDKLGWGKYMQRNKVTYRDWVIHGGDIKSAEPFRANMKGILDLARENETPVLMMTFCYYVAEGYTDEKYMNGKLDYAGRFLPLEKYWGNPEHVTEGIEVHNAIVRELARGRDGVMLVDQRRDFPAEGRYFYDVCHLTTDGDLLFVDNMMRRIEYQIRRAAEAGPRPR